MILGNADAGIGDRHRHRFPVQRSAHGDLASLACELDRVGQQVQQDLLEPLLVRLDKNARYFPSGLQRGCSDDASSELMGTASPPAGS